jgi:hypothetical protein
MAGAFIEVPGGSNRSWSDWADSGSTSGEGGCDGVADAVGGIRDGEGAGGLGHASVGGEIGEDGGGVGGKLVEARQIGDWATENPPRGIFSAPIIHTTNVAPATLVVWMRGGRVVWRCGRSPLSHCVRI